MLKWVFGADTSPFRRSLNEMRGEVKSFSGSVTGQIAGIFGGAALLASAGKIVEHFARIKDLADRFGESTDGIQRVGYAAEQSGMEIEGIAKAMTVATKKAVEAVNSGGALADTFKRLGINAAEFAGMSLEDKLRALNEGYNGSASSAQGLSDVIDAMGKQGGEAIPLLTQSVEELNAQLEKAPVAGAGVVSTIAGIDDKIQEMKGQALAVGGAIVAGIAAIAATISTVALSALEFFGDELVRLGQLAVITGTVMRKTLMGDFKGAAESAKDFGTVTKTRFNDMINDAKKTGESISGIWEEVFDAKSTTKAKGLSPAEIKAAADAEAKALEKKRNLTEEIAKLEEDARIKSLSLAEKILDAEKRRAELAASGLFDPDEIKALEARKGQLEAEKEIAGYRKEQADIDKKAADDKQKAIEKNADDMVKLAEKSVELDRSNKLAGMKDPEKLKFLKEERAKALRDQKEANARGDYKGGLEAGNKAKGLTGDINSIMESRKSSLESSLAALQSRGPTIATASLTDIGGGRGGSKVLETNYQQKQTDIQTEILQIIKEMSSGGDGKNPDPI